MIGQYQITNYKDLAVTIDADTTWQLWTTKQYCLSPQMKSIVEYKVSYVAIREMVPIMSHIFTIVLRRASISYLVPLMDVSVSSAIRACCPLLKLMIDLDILRPITTKITFTIQLTAAGSRKQSVWHRDPTSVLSEFPRFKVYPTDVTKTATIAMPMKMRSRRRILLFSSRKWADFFVKKQHIRKSIIDWIVWEAISTRLQVVVTAPRPKSKFQKYLLNTENS